MGCDPRIPRPPPNPIYFNPRTPVGCDDKRGFRRKIDAEFQSTHPSGVRPLTVAMVLSSDVFQSTHPSGVRQHTGLPDSMRVLFQSTHPSGVRPVQFTPLGTVTDFNPRTPVGCDPCSASGARRSRYFNPRTPVGCDSMLSIARNIDVQFQSTHPSGVRHAHHGHAHRPRRISIHAPQWGATRGRMRHVRHRAISIHAPQWGATSADGLPCGAAKLFQSTPPSGVRPSAVWSARGAATDFNPRTPVGCDGGNLHRPGRDIGISIHAPQWGAT